MVDVHKLYSKFHKTRLLDDPLPISADELEELFQEYFSLQRDYDDLLTDYLEKDD